MDRNCQNNPNSFCYICGKVTFKDFKGDITSIVKSLYFAYFGISLWDQDKHFAPHICCKNCVTALRGWSKGQRKSMPFGVPMVWMESSDHTKDFYFCMTNIQ
ncbi:Uncharacterized protein FKW44_021838, partial [Caligus rogercresseyi]